MISPLVWFSTRTGLAGPASPTANKCQHSFPFAEIGALVAVGCIIGAGNVGMDMTSIWGVKVGSGVGLGTSVGGSGVAEGTASCVIATIVNADETAVF